MPAVLSGRDWLWCAEGRCEQAIPTCAHVWKYHDLQRLRVPYSSFSLLRLLFKDQTGPGRGTTAADTASGYFEIGIAG